MDVFADSAITLREFFLQDADTIKLCTKLRISQITAVHQKRTWGLSLECSLKHSGKFLWVVLRISTWGSFRIEF